MMALWERISIPAAAVLRRTLSGRFQQCLTLSPKATWSSASVTGQDVKVTASLSSSVVAMTTSRRSVSYQCLRGMSTNHEKTSPVIVPEEETDTRLSTDAADIMSAETRLSTDAADVMSAETRLSTDAADVMSALEKLDNLDENTKKKLKIIQMEYEVQFYMSNMGKKVPDKVSDETWLKLLQCPDKKSRFTLLEQLRKIEKKPLLKLEKKQKKEKRKQERLREMEKDDVGPFMANRDRFVLSVRKPEIKRFERCRLAQAMLHGPPVVFDLSWETSMNEKECRQLKKQLAMAYSVNSAHPNPVHMVLCNAVPDSKIIRMWQEKLGVPSLDDYLFTLSEKSYLDLYPREKLVYLSPDSRNILDSFETDSVYIIGGLVEKAAQMPVTRARAKVETIRTAKFPLERYLQWVRGSKTLDVDKVMQVVLEMYTSGDWKKALNQLPERFYTEFPGQERRKSVPQLQWWESSK